MAGIRSFERRILVDTFGRLLWQFRRQPWHAAFYMGGVALPPHERFWLGVYFSDAKENNVLASRGTSKCLEVGTNVIMADGSRRAVEDVAVGDAVMGPDSQPRTVLDTTRGTGQLWEVRQSSGMDYTVNDDHILALRQSGAMMRSGQHAQRHSEYTNVSVRDFVYNTPHFKQQFRGYRAGLLAFPAQAVPVDPYFLGLWLGDGCGRNPIIYNADVEVITYLQDFATTVGAVAVLTDLPTTVAKKIRITANGGRNGNPLWQAMRALGVTNPAAGRGVNNKHIPHRYIANSEAVRLALLAGVIDSDGTVSKKGYVITQTVERLARDVKYLADSLGFRTSLRHIPTLGFGKPGMTWRVGINGDIHRIPVRIARKKLTAEQFSPNKDKSLSMLDVVPVGIGEWAGFTVDGDHLFLLEDCTVTHNSFSHASLAAPLKAVLYKDLAILTLSNSGFRGGKELFKDAERLFLGQLKSQELPGQFLRACIATPRIIAKDPSQWTINLRSQSRYSTAPTNNPDQLRGLRANEVLLDERAFLDNDISHKIMRPMLSVGMDFRRAAQGGDRNKMYQVSTIDFTVRGWWTELMVAEKDQKNEYAAWKARTEGDWAEYDRLMNDNEGRLRTLSFSYTKVDYTDLLIPQFVPTLDGEKRYRTEYPREKGIEVEDVLRYDELDKVAYFYTYPVDKKGLEEPLRAGTVDTEIWRAEQRNIPISASGNVFDHELLQRVAERPISTGKKKKKEEGDDTEDEFYAPVMFSCGDPCVLSVDVARESDEVAFVVTRLGEKAEGEFSPFIPKMDKLGRPMLGRTTWNHVCWAESHRRMEANAVATKIRDLKARYNIVMILPTAITPGVGGIAMDQKGGGSAVRDDLGNPKPPIDDEGIPVVGWKWDDVEKIFDPEDIEGYAHYSALNKPERYWGGLRLINATNQNNVEWTFATRGMMQASKLYIGYWMPPSRWAFDKGIVTPSGEPDKTHPEYVKWEIGFTGIRRLKTQLLRLQTKVSEQGVMRFVMPGDRSKEDGKKDFWAALIYGMSLVREHLKIDDDSAFAAPMVAPLIVHMGGQNSLLPNLFGQSDRSHGW